MYNINIYINIFNVYYKKNFTVGYGNSGEIYQKRYLWPTSG